LKNYKLPVNDQILAGGEKLQSEVHELVNSVWNKEGLPEQCMESYIVAVYKEVTKTDSRNYCGISLLSTSYKVSFSIILSEFNPYR
jgi:hypothetical protein